MGGSRGRTWTVRAFIGISLLVAGMAIEISRDALFEGDVPPEPSEPPGAFRFVALGDSYISGEGAEAFYEGTNEEKNRCRRAPTSYPYVIGRVISVTPLSAACSSARTFDILSRAQFPESPATVIGGKPQIEVLAATEDVDLVLVSIGGNDARFAEIGIRCTNPFKGTCVTKKEQWMANLKDVGGHLRDVYREIRETAPGAQVFVVNYPNPFGEEYCSVIPTLEKGEHEFLTEEFIPELNATIQRAADAAQVAVIDIAEAFKNWRLCEVKPGDAAVNIVALSRTGGRGSLHPNELGHTLIARVVGTVVVQAWLESSPLPKPVPEPSGR